MPEGPDQSHYFGGGVTATVLHPAVLVAMLIAIVLILVLPRKYVIVAVLLGIFLVPMGQQVLIGGVHWLVSRIIVLCGLLRVVIGRESLAGGFNSVDRAFLGCILCEAVGLILQYHLASQAWINQFGFLIDFLGGYFLVRALIQNEEDIYRTLKWVALVTVILAICMVGEQLTLQNV